MLAFSSISAEYLQKFEFLISQGIVATCLRWGGRCHMGFVANFIRLQQCKNFENRLRFISIWFKGGNFYDANLACGDKTFINIFYHDLKSSKSGQVDLVFLLLDQGSLVGLCIQDYKSPCATDNVLCRAGQHPDRRTHTVNIWPAYMNSSSASWYGWWGQHGCQVNLPAWFEWSLCAPTIWLTDNRRYFPAILPGNHQPNEAAVINLSCIDHRQSVLSPDMSLQCLWLDISVMWLVAVNARRDVSSVPAVTISARNIETTTLRWRWWPLNFYLLLCFVK